jgi:aminoglycoside phosphotransferase (APT) family kinase protein
MDTIAPAKAKTTSASKKPLEAEMAGLVLLIAESLYKSKPEITNYGASSDGVWGLHFDDKKVDRVIKLGVKSSGSLLREQKIIQSLHRFELPIPEIEFTQVDLPNVWIPFMVMPKIGNATLKDVCRNDRPFALAKCHQAGEFAARLSQIPVSAIDIQPEFALMPEDFKEEQMFEAIGMEKWQKVMSKFKQWDVLTPPVQKILSAVKSEIEQKNYTNIIHQDFIPRQILVNPQQFAVIDWETAAPSSTLIDIGDFLGGMHRSLRNKDNKVTYTNAFLDGFCSISPLSTEEMSKIALWEAYSTLNVAMAMGRRKKHEQVSKFINIALEGALIHEYQTSTQSSP